MHNALSGHLPIAVFLPTQRRPNTMDSKPQYQGYYRTPLWRILEGPLISVETFVTAVSHAGPGKIVNVGHNSKLDHCPSAGAAIEKAASDLDSEGTKLLASVEKSLSEKVVASHCMGLVDHP